MEALRVPVLIVSIAALLGSGMPLAGASELTVLDTLPLEGVSFAAWKVHFPGGTSFEIGAAGRANIAPDTGSITWMVQVIPVEDPESGGGVGLFILTFDTAADTVAVHSSTGLVDFGVTTYEGSGYTQVGFSSTVGESNPGGIPAGDYYVMAAMGQDGTGFSGEFELLGEGVTPLDSDHGPAFYFRERNYPALVNAQLDQTDRRVRSIEGGLVEQEVTGRLFAALFHMEFMPAPIWFPQTSGIWVEGPGIPTVAEGAQDGVEWFLNDCPETIVLFCLGPAAEGGLAGQSWGSFTIHDGAPGLYRFRVDHWNTIEAPQYPWWNPTPILSLIGADVHLE